MKIQLASDLHLEFSITTKILEIAIPSIAIKFKNGNANF